jgi:hypothetical protein
MSGWFFLKFPAGGDAVSGLRDVLILTCLKRLLLSALQN